ncbi:class I SAM-dependent DNA methyltransferase [Paenibacillus beijingensis]|uniref:Uncharacterized methyltransferase VN24_22980 n=1 Tax=Paenibacillus beijingensis TaxID=1126833 RepID=A0A0D5NP09_9BACL|nr:class I SAM-dependent methyltransferase [Paenibacillus beijingensis]AJY76900.1 SAM-dependent methyltransferase [Paenibacillus beijingensis]
MGREFVSLFDQWSEEYDRTVSGHDEQYREVFEHYGDILEAVASRSFGTVVEFGAGTGNLSEQLLRRGLKVYGVEPSQGMRAQIQKRNLDFVLLDGDFLHFPPIPEQVNSIVSTYAFHHLTDEEKEQALSIYSTLLGKGGKIVFADIAFRDEQDREKTEAYIAEKGHFDLLQDLQTEYSTTLDRLKSMFNRHGFSVSFGKLNRYVWLMEAAKGHTQS